MTWRIGKMQSREELRKRCHTEIQGDVEG